MKDGWAAFAVVFVTLWTGPMACSQPAGRSGSGGAAASDVATTTAPGERQPTAAGSAAAPPLGPSLPAGQRRVALYVVPGDALVEIEGRPVRRRNGVVELIGADKEKVRVRVRKGERSTEEVVVTITAAGASPSQIQLPAPPPRPASTLNAIDIDD